AAAVRIAAGLARRRGRTLRLLHVVKAANGHPFNPHKGWAREMRAASEARLAHDAARLRHQGIAVEAQVVFGRPASIILELSRKPEVELVTLGSSGHEADAPMRVGSVARSV